MTYFLPVAAWTPMERLPSPLAGSPTWVVESRAANGRTSPPPTRVTGVLETLPSRSTVRLVMSAPLTRRRLMAAGSSDGWAWRRMAAAAATTGVEPDVPLNGRSEVPVPATADVHAPGAARSGLMVAPIWDGPRDDEISMVLVSEMRLAGSRQTSTGPAATAPLRRSPLSWVTKTVGTIGVPWPALRVGGTPGRSLTSTTARAPAAPALATFTVTSHVPRSMSAMRGIDGSKPAKLLTSHPWLAAAPDAPIGPAGTVRVPVIASAGAGAHVCGTAYLAVLPARPSMVGLSTSMGSNEASGSAVSATAMAAGAIDGWPTIHGRLPSLPAATATTTPACTALVTARVSADSGWP